MTKLENHKIKFIQYKDNFCGSWGLGFSLSNDSKVRGWEYNPVSTRLVNRNIMDYPLSENIGRNETIFKFGFNNDN